MILSVNSSSVSAARYLPRSDKRLVRRPYVRFCGSPDIADYPPWLVCDANDPQTVIAISYGNTDHAMEAWYHCSIA
jgi:hypothetical protein